MYYVALCYWHVISNGGFPFIRLRTVTLTGKYDIANFSLGQLLT